MEKAVGEVYSFFFFFLLKKGGRGKSSEFVYTITHPQLSEPGPRYHRTKSSFGSSSKGAMQSEERGAEERGRGIHTDVKALLHC